MKVLPMLLTLYLLLWIPAGLVARGLFLGRIIKEFPWANPTRVANMCILCGYGSLTSELLKWPWVWRWHSTTKEERWEAFKKCYPTLTSAPEAKERFDAFERE